MKTSHGWIQGYNAQILVEEASGVIVAQEVTAHSVDSPRLRPMLDRLEENLARVGVPEEERRPKWFTADAGYCSENNLRTLAERQIDAYVATGRERHHRAESPMEAGPGHPCGPPCGISCRPRKGGRSTPGTKPPPNLFMGQPSKPGGLSGNSCSGAWKSQQGSSHWWPCPTIS